MKHSYLKDRLDKRERTLTQNRAMHLWFTMVADALNDAGLDMRTVLKPEIEIPWTESTVKNHLWRPVQKAMLDKESTADLTTKELTEVEQVLSRHLAEKHGIHVPFPSIEEEMLKTLTNEN